MTAWILTANLLGWPLIHMATSFVALRLPASLFAEDNWVTAPRQWEKDGFLYRKWLGVRKWKSLLPDGAPWLGGMPKRRLHARNSVYLERFLCETRRAEWAHWCMFSFLPFFFLWNPLWARLVMTAYAAAVNLPCIVAQRYNRIALERVLRTRRGVVNCV